jgi:L-alanine-DL-glutamate epimerase-like enolase superfamily enzyme
MRLEAEKFRIKLRRPFRIAHGWSVTRETILVHLYDEEANIVAHGEGALPPYYPSTANACLAWLNEVAQKGDASRWQDACVAEGPPEAAAGRAALEIALQDLKAQRAERAIWQLWGLDPAQIPSCWRTLSIASSEGELRDMLDDAISAGSKRIKLKTGSGDLGWDQRCIQLAAERPVQVGLDANEGWTPAEAATIVSRLGYHDVAFVEQPVSRDVAGWRDFRSRLGEAKIPPLIADESLQSEEDFGLLHGLVDGVNVKLLKAGGLDAARRWISLARGFGMRVMVGTMVETGIGRTAAAQLAPLADWLDIDPPDTIPAAPMIGFRIEGDRLMLADRPGLGLLPVGLRVES